MIPNDQFEEASRDADEPAKASIGVIDVMIVDEQPHVVVVEDFVDNLSD